MDAEKESRDTCGVTTRGGPSDSSSETTHWPEERNTEFLKGEKERERRERVSSGGVILKESRENGDRGAKEREGK